MLKEALNFVSLTEEEEDALSHRVLKELEINFFVLHMEEERGVYFLTVFDQQWEVQIFAHLMEEAENAAMTGAQNRHSPPQIFV